MFVSGLVDEERNVTSTEKIKVYFKKKADIANYIREKGFVITNKLEAFGGELGLVNETTMSKSDCWEMMKEFGLAGWYENKTMRIY